MTLTLEQFASDCKAALSAPPEPDGIEAVRKLLEEALKDDEFIQTYLGPDADSQRNIIYEDPDLGFCIIAHVYKGSSVGNPHDHADAWAIYGQASGVTRMTEWRKISAPDGDTPGTVEEVRSFDQNPGDASAWQVGDLHSPAREGETRLIRIEGRNMDGVKRDKYARPDAA
ncbi:MAG: hypothetical protein HQ503_13565 [Rhodospirillales bacterium]|nr:hypothetical protein [Rhodospirillales bacterium]